MAQLSKMKAFCCLEHSGQQLDEKPQERSNLQPYTDKEPPTREQVAQQIVDDIFRADINDAILQAKLRQTIHTYNWYEGLAVAVLSAMELALKAGIKMGPVVQDAYDRAVAAVHNIKEWETDNPEVAAIILTVVAIGVCAIVMPWLMGALGFAEEGIIAGSWAARWQSLYEGFVPKGSLFSYLQSLGTKVGESWRG